MKFTYDIPVTLGCHRGHTYDKATVVEADYWTGELSLIISFYGDLRGLCSPIWWLGPESDNCPECGGHATLAAKMEAQDYINRKVKEFLAAREAAELAQGGS